MRNRWIAFVALLFCLVNGSSLQAVDPPSVTPLLSQQASSSSVTPVAIVALHGEVNEFTVGLLERQIKQARQAGAKTIILDMNTYGGSVPPALEVTHFLRQQTDLHTIAYVDPRLLGRRDDFCCL